MKKFNHILKTSKHNIVEFTADVLAKSLETTLVLSTRANFATVDYPQSWNGQGSHPRARLRALEYQFVTTG